jgi:hypothetical protein
MKPSRQPNAKRPSAEFLRRFLEKNMSPQIPDFFRNVGDLSGVSG